MTMCTKCWNDAYPISKESGKTQYECYLELLEEREGNPCGEPEEKELTPQQLSTKNDTKRRDAVAQALGFGSMRKFGTALVKAHKMRTLDKLLAEMSPENARLRDALKELIEASGNIYDVSENSWLPRKGIVCPHGNGGFYPSSAHWCDDCFERLGFAIQGSKEALKEKM